MKKNSANKESSDSIAEPVLREFSAQLQGIFDSLLRRSPYWVDSSWELHLFLNPAAGGMTAPELRKNALKDLSAAAQAFDDLPECCGPATIQVHESQAPGGITLLVQAVCEASPSSRNLLFVSFGGDGTHQEVLNGLAGESAQAHSIRFCRVPLGTGNDGVDIASLRELPGILFSAPSLEGQPLEAVRVRTGTGELAYSGNIAGIGMDAYVVFLSEDYKKRLPGKAYKIAADLGVLFYKRKFDLQAAHIETEAVDGTRQEFSFLPGIVSFGASGYRTYGRGLPVLPDRENICLIPVGTLFQNIALKQQLFLGTHCTDSRVSMVEARKMVVDYRGRLPMQLDGEVRWLDPEDFPVILERISLPARVLRSRTIGAAARSQQSQPAELHRASSQKHPGSA